VTSASLVSAIRQLAPAIPLHLAISIAVNALGYGRAYEVPPEMIVAVAMHPAQVGVTNRPDLIPETIGAIAREEKPRMRNGESTRGGTIKRLAASIRAVAESTTKET
jgi:hypothetical protein